MSSSLTCMHWFTLYRILNRTFSRSLEFFLFAVFLFLSFWPTGSSCLCLSRLTLCLLSSRSHVGSASVLHALLPKNSKAEAVATGELSSIISHLLAITSLAEWWKTFFHKHCLFFGVFVSAEGKSGPLLNLGWKLKLLKHIVLYNILKIDNNIVG